MAAPLTVSSAFADDTAALPTEATTTSDTATDAGGVPAQLDAFASPAEDTAADGPGEEAHESAESGSSDGAPAPSGQSNGEPAADGEPGTESSASGSAPTTDSVLTAAPAVETLSAPGTPTNVVVTGTQRADDTWSMHIAWGASDPITADTTYTVNWNDHYNFENATGLSTNSYDFVTSMPVDVARDPNAHIHLVVQAVNSSGASSANAPLIFYRDLVAITPPGPPTGLVTARATDRSAATLSWSAPATDGNSPITGYTVSVTDGTTAETVSLGAGVTAHAFEGLRVGAVYTYAVIASNSQFSGVAATTSAPFAAVTATAPLQPAGRSTSPREASITWSAPGYDGGTPITNYRVVIDGADVTTPNADTAIDVELGPVVNETLDILVSASNDGGLTFGPATAGVVEFGSFAPDAPAATVEAINFHDASVLVKWTTPVANGSDITGYDVYLSVGDLPFARQSVGPDVDSVLISGLQAQTVYTAVVVATNAIGESDPSDAAAATTLPSAPSAVPSGSVGESGDISLAFAGDTVSATVNGVPAGTWLYAYVYSDPQGLGWAQVGANGVATWSMSGTQLPAGQHHILLLDENGAPVASTAFAVAAPAASSTTSSGSAALLASTGGETGGAESIAFALLALGAILTVLRRRLGNITARD